MVAPAPRQYVLTGAPGGGKSTLLGEAHNLGIVTSPEVARAILDQPGGMELRRDDPLGFAEAMLEGHRREWERHAGSGISVIFDRGFPDVVGFLEVSGLKVSPQIDRVCQALRYSGPILRAPAWREIYRQDAQRIQSWEEAVASDEAVTAAWLRYGYEVSDLPLASVAERLAFLREQPGKPVV